MSNSVDIVTVGDSPNIKLGEHLILDFNECKAVDENGKSVLCNIEYIEEILLRAAEIGGMTYMAHKMVKYPPNGSVSGVVIVSESHISIHTWDEYYYAMVDINSCGDVNGVMAAMNHLMRTLGSTYPKITRVERGVYKQKYFRDKSNCL